MKKIIFVITIIATITLVSFINKERDYNFKLTQREAEIIVYCLERDTIIKYKDYKTIVGKMVYQFRDTTLNPIQK